MAVALHLRPLVLVSQEATALSNTIAKTGSGRPWAYPREPPLSLKIPIVHGPIGICVGGCIGLCRSFR
jgi:hypothetical protein